AIHFSRGCVGSALDVLYIQRILSGRRDRWEAEELERLKANGKTPTDDRWKQKYKEPEAPDTSELPTLPEGWTWTSLDQLLYELRNGIATRPEGENGSRILRISAVRPLRVDLNDVRFLQEEGAQYVTYELREGDLLFTRYNGNPVLVGVCGAVTGITERTIYPDKLIRARLLGPDVRPEYVAIAVNTGYSRRFISSRVKTTAGQSGVAGADLKRMPVPLPP